MRRLDMSRLASKRAGVKPGRIGATVLEMAIAAPVVLLLLIGMFEMGISVYAYNTLAEAVRAGARYAAVHGAKAATPCGPTANNTNVENVVRGYAPGIVATDLTVTSTWPDGNNSTGSHVTVAATYTYRFAATKLLGMQTLKLSSTSTTVINH